MPTLRIKKSGSSVQAVFQDTGELREDVTHPFSFALTPQDTEDIRWYFEDYLLYSSDPAPKLASRIEARLTEIGHELFTQVFVNNGVWESARTRLAETRVEIETDLHAGRIPWELLRDPETGVQLAVDSLAFVRVHPNPEVEPNVAVPRGGKVRILLVISRPDGSYDVPFRSVARHLIRGLSEAARQPLYLEVLRPPTFERLTHRLREASEEGDPFDVVHFDGHGTSGYVFFEGSNRSVRASDLGALLNATEVPVLTLNACRSAHSEPHSEPHEVTSIHEQIRQFGSLAHIVTDCGVCAVLAWGYNVFVGAAAQFMADMYSGLASGLSLGESASLSRRRLRGAGRPIQDWTVPIVFEAEPIRLFPQSLVNQSSERVTPVSDFVGQDEALLRLDRAFDENHSIVVLHGYAGSGKTTVAREFARWYTETAGLIGPVLFTSFETSQNLRHKTLRNVLDQLAQEFSATLQRRGVLWELLDGSERLTEALKLLNEFSLFWVWDNVESISGVPEGTSYWTQEEQEELATFLGGARKSKARFLLTSRRDERAWLHGLSAPVQIPLMSYWDSIELVANVTAERWPRFDVKDWHAPVRFAHGNPLTLRILVGQVLHNGLKTRQEIETLIDEIRSGERILEDDFTQGRAQSLAASLTYAFENAFTDLERSQLALLHLFQGCVVADDLAMMGVEDWHLPQVKDVSIEYSTSLLDRAAEVGILMSMGPRRWYTIHPTLPWFLSRFFDLYYAEATLSAYRAFTEAMGQFGIVYQNMYIDGSHSVASVIAIREDNFLSAWHLARTNGWWEALIHVTQALRFLYVETGRHADWSRLVDALLPHFVDPRTRGSIAGREDYWGLVMSYRVGLAKEARRWEEAEELCKVQINQHQGQVKDILSRPLSAWEEIDKRFLRSYAVTLVDLSESQWERGLSTCVSNYQEALSILESIHDLQTAAVCAQGLGNAYSRLGNSFEASKWYSHGLELSANDPFGQAMCLHGLGSVAMNRFLAAKDIDQSSADSFNSFSEAVDCYSRAIKVLPPDASNQLGHSHRELGRVYGYVGQLDLARDHFLVSCHYWDILNMNFEAGKTRYLAATMFGLAGRYAEAQDWVVSAMANFEACANSGPQMENCLAVLKLIQRDEGDG